MEKGFLDKVEDNAVVRIWSKKTQQEKGDSLTEGYVSKLWDFTHISVTQSNLQKLKEVWDQWDDKTKQLFYCNYGDLSYLLDVKVDKHLFQALAQYWNPTYSCFTFGKVDLVPTVEEYTTLLRCPRIQANKVYSRAANILTFLKKLMTITRMTLGHIDEVVSDIFDWLDKRVTPVPVILAETFRSLSACQRAGKGRFIGCAQLLLAWFYNHFWKIWEAVGYAPLLVLRQYRSRRFIPVTQGLAQCEFVCKEKMQLELDVDVQKLEAQKMRKGKIKAKEDLDSLKTYYKKLCLSIRTAELGKTSEQWQQDIKEEKIRADQWEKKFQKA
ncbi:hypothetical protein Gohar_028313 [Gossypium harknessii]|uniref:DUF7745 domain-containing protein n=2 Tax=Gossypium harknessii TaxID=34285 RepID=A0A7J9IF07_9ROSI|nr:hypothetical protein [Gossypium harknessii]